MDGNSLSNLLLELEQKQAMAVERLGVCIDRIYSAGVSNDQ